MCVNGTGMGPTLALSFEDLLEREEQARFGRAAAEARLFRNAAG